MERKQKDCVTYKKKEDDSNKKTGLAMCERALELGYSVSIPPWEEGIKDVNDAVIKYGKLPTLLAILQNATMSKIKLELRKKQIVKGI